MSKRRIAITGLGVVSPFGSTWPTWKAILENRSAVRWLGPEHFEQATGVEFAAPVDVTTQPGQSRSVMFAQRAARDCLSDIKEAGVRTACVIGTSKPDLRSVDDWLMHAERDYDFPSIEAAFPASPAQHIARRFRLRGPLLCPVAACATGLVSLIRAADLIRHGDADSALAGSVDSSIHAGLLSSYRRLGVHAKVNENPATACRPFDRHRTGFAVGEGAAVMMLQDWEQAAAQGQPVLAEWVDGLIGCDPTGMTSVDVSGQSLAELIQRLLKSNGISPEEVSAVCYHGTATEMNDLAESAAIRRVFPDPPLGFGIKGAIGHLMGAAGAVETAISVMALQQQTIPPTVNHEQHDPLCPNCVTGSQPIEQPLKYLLKTSLGFGGHLAVGLLKRV